MIQIYAIPGRQGEWQEAGPSRYMARGAVAGENPRQAGRIHAAGR